MKKIQRGFTLIELVVVIGIIAVLAGLILVRISNASADARNARRQSDINQMKNAIEQWRINDVTTATACRAVTRAWSATTNTELESTTDATRPFNIAAGSGPSKYLSENKYPIETQSGVGAYSITVSDAATCRFVITAQKEPSGTYTAGN